VSAAPTRAVPDTSGSTTLTGGVGVGPPAPPQAGATSEHGAMNALLYTFHAVAR
jgi:hypothetical protein